MLKKSVFLLLFLFISHNSFAAPKVIHNGVLQAYWELEWNKDFTKSTPKLHLRYLVSEKSKSVKVIMLDMKQSDIKHVINLYFKKIPASFYKYSEGHIENSGHIIINNIVETGDCDGTFSSAQLQSYTPLASITLKDIDTIQRAILCDISHPYTTTYEPREDLKDIYLRKSPSLESEIVAQVHATNALVKIKTVDDKWILVGVYDYNSPDFIGIPKGYVEIKNLNLNN